MDSVARKFLLVCLQLIIVLVMSMIVEGMPKPKLIESSNWDPLQERDTIFSRRAATGQEREYRLYNVCSEKTIAITQRRVTTTAKQNDTNAELVLETIWEGDSFHNRTLKTRIRGRQAGKYLCYNHRGKMTTKPEGKARGKNCHFFEELVHGEFRYKSVVNDRWLIGFNQKGQPLLGSKHVDTHREPCFRFHKVPIPNRTRNGYDLEEHNRLIGHKRTFEETVVESNHRLRHRKKSHRRTRPQRSSVDR